MGHLATQLKKQPDQMAKYKALDAGEKKAWLCRFRVDPTLAWLTAETGTQVGKKSSKESTERVLTEPELAGPKYLNSDVNAKLVFEWAVTHKLIVKHSHPTLQGIPCIRWSDSYRSMSDYFDEHSKTCAEGQLDVETYDKIEQAMRSTEVPKPKNICSNSICFCN